MCVFIVIYDKIYVYVSLSLSLYARLSWPARRTQSIVLYIQLFNPITCRKLSRLSEDQGLGFRV